MAVRRMIGYAPQQRSADGSLTGVENVSLFARLFDVPRRHRRHALYPVVLMPGWLQVISHLNPLSYQVDALRGLLIGTPSHLTLDFGVVVLATTVAVAAASAFLRRLAR
jgi:hypothetical protein